MRQIPKLLIIGNTHASYAYFNGLLLCSVLNIETQLYGDFRQLLLKIKSSTYSSETKSLYKRVRYKMNILCIDILLMALLHHCSNRARESSNKQGQRLSYQDYRLHQTATHTQRTNYTLCKYKKYTTEHGGKIDTYLELFPCQMSIGLKLEDLCLKPQCLMLQ